MMRVGGFDVDIDPKMQDGPGADLLCLGGEGGCVTNRMLVSAETRNCTLDHKRRVAEAPDKKETVLEQRPVDRAESQPWAFLVPFPRVLAAKGCECCWWRTN